MWPIRQFCVIREGVALRGDDAGDLEAPPVLLLHGGGQTRHSWDGTRDVLAAIGYRVIALDLRGHGESDWDRDGDYSNHAFGEDIAAVAEQLDRPVLVGASLGGMAALLAAEAVPSVRGLVLVDVAIQLEMRGVERIRSFMMSSPDGFASLDEAADAIAAYRGAPRRARSSGLDKNLRLGADGRYRWHWDPRFFGGDRVPGSRVDPGRLDAAAASLSLPVLLVRGLQSDMVSDASVAHFRSLVPHALVADVSGAGHMVVGDRNDAFGEAISPFLASTLGADRADVRNVLAG